MEVNGRLETNVPGVYALSDAKGGPAFTHISYDGFRIVQTNPLEDGDVTITGRFVPYTVFIDPHLGRVGLSEEEARDQGRDVRVAKLPMSSVPRALEVDEPRGLMKAVVDTDTYRILGCAVLGIEGGEVMAMIQIDDGWVALHGPPRRRLFPPNPGRVFKQPVRHRRCTR